MLGTSLPPGAFDARQVAALDALELGFTAIEVDLSDEDGLATASEKIAAAPGPLRIDIRKSEEKKTLAAVTTLAPLLANKAVIGLSLWDAEDSTIAAARDCGAEYPHRRRHRRVLHGIEPTVPLAGCRLFDLDLEPDGARLE